MSSHQPRVAQKVEQRDTHKRYLILDNLIGCQLGEEEHNPLGYVVREAVKGRDTEFLKVKKMSFYWWAVWVVLVVTVGID